MLTSQKIITFLKLPHSARSSYAHSYTSPTVQVCIQKLQSIDIVVSLNFGDSRQQHIVYVCTRPSSQEVDICIIDTHLYETKGRYT